MARIKLTPKPSSPTLPLALASDPVRQFAEFEQLLVANSGEDAFDVALKLVAAKIEDELQARDSGAGRRFMTGSTAQESHQRVEQLLRDAAERWSGIIEFNGGLVLTPEQLSRCTRCLVGWDILDTSFHHLDAMLERLVARGSKGTLGQYFTPRAVIQMCVAAVNPTAVDTVIDPACGSGGFLVEALDHADGHAAGAKSKGPKCLGIDYSAKSLKVASLLAVAAGRDRVFVSQANSVDGRDFIATEPPQSWSGFLREPTGRERWGPWSLLEGSVVLTNPPFAGDIDEMAIIDAYESQRGASRGRRGAVSREHLFLERAVQLLKPRGRLAIVVPQGLLANSSASYLRHWLLREVRVVAVIGLHPYSFLPHTGVKTAVLIAVKEAPPKDYEVLFLSSADPGKDSRGKVTGEGDYPGLAAMVQSFARELGYEAWAGNAVAKRHREHLVPNHEIMLADRLDAEYYAPALRKVHERAQRLGVGSLGASVTGAVARFKKRDFDEIEYIDISSVDGKTGLAIPNRMAADDAPSRASVIVQRGDVLVSTVRPERNVVAFVNQEPEAVTVASSGFCVLRPKSRVAPELLFAFCKSDLFKSMVSRCATASMYPAVTDGDVLQTPALLPEGELAEGIVSRVSEALRKIEEARADLSQAIGMMNDFHVQALGEKV